MMSALSFVLTIASVFVPLPSMPPLEGTTSTTAALTSVDNIVLPALRKSFGCLQVRTQHCFSSPQRCLLVAVCCRPTDGVCAVQQPGLTAGRATDAGDGGHCCF